MTTSCCTDSTLGGCEILRNALVIGIEHIHQREHGVLDQTWARPILTPPDGPWWECSRDPCAITAALVRQGDKSCREHCGVNRYLGNPPGEGESSVDQQGSTHPR